MKLACERSTLSLSLCKSALYAYVQTIVACAPVTVCVQDQINAMQDHVVPSSSANDT